MPTTSLSQVRHSVIHCVVFFLCSLEPICLWFLFVFNMALYGIENKKRIEFFKFLTSSSSALFQAKKESLSRLTFFSYLLCIGRPVCKTSMHETVPSIWDLVSYSYKSFVCWTNATKSLLVGVDFLTTIHDRLVSMFDDLFWNTKFVCYSLEILENFHKF